MNEFSETIKNSMLIAFLYDFFKFSFSYLVVRLIYDEWWKKIRWGHWKLIIKEGGEIKTERELSHLFGERIRTDENEFSVYVKGVVSPYARLNVDVCSERAEKSGLVQRPPRYKGRSVWRKTREMLFGEPKRDRVITIDLDKNPKGQPKPKSVTIEEVKSLLEQYCSKPPEDDR